MIKKRVSSLFIILFLMGLVAVPETSYSHSPFDVFNPSVDGVGNSVAVQPNGKILIGSQFLLSFVRTASGV